MPFEHEAGRLRKVARDRRVLIFYTAHAEVERKKDGIQKIDIANMLCRCSVSLVEVLKETGEEEWRAEGRDFDGRQITAVVVVYEAATEIRSLRLGLRNRGKERVMRRCTKCKDSLMERSVKAEHIEDLGGLVVKVLNAVVVYRCSACGDELTGIPDMQGLARAAAIVRALNPVRLSGSEIKFMRRTLDMTQKKFAEAMELSSEYVSRWENNHNGIGGASEKLVRHNICALLRNEGVCEYDPKVIANMKIQSRNDDAALPPIEMVRVRIAHRVDGEDGTWSEAA